MDNRASLLIHEAGHAANLLHSFDCPIGEDSCADTSPTDGTNHMSWSGCDDDHFTCCQLAIMHEELANADYATAASSHSCQASFEITEIKKYCNLVFTNTSTSSSSGPLTNDWCVENLATGEFTEYQTQNLAFDADDATDYEICLCISDGICESFYCEIINYSPVPEGHTEDADGNESDIFCADEDIYFDARESMYESQYFIAIW